MIYLFFSSETIFNAFIILITFYLHYFLKFKHINFNFNLDPSNKTPYYFSFVYY